MFRVGIVLTCLVLTLTGCNSDDRARFDAEVERASAKVEAMNAAETARYAPKLNDAALTDLKAAKELAGDQLFTQAEPKLASFHQKADAAIDHAKNEKAKAMAKDKEVVYKVKKGDWIYKIARQHGVTWKQIIDLNKDQLVNPNQIFPGQVLKMPN